MTNCQIFIRQLLLFCGVLQQAKCKTKISFLYDKITVLFIDNFIFTNYIQYVSKHAQTLMRD